MSKIFIVTPARPGARSGNLHTATRWASMLRSAGHRVAVGLEWQGEPCNLLIALHARRSHDSVIRYRQARPQGRLVVVLTGTDLYQDLPASAEARRSLELADRLIVLQEAALLQLKPSLRRKTKVVYQSTDTRFRHAPTSRRFRIAVVGHLRAVKDPFRAALALSHLPGLALEVLHVGGALEEKYAREAKRLMRRDARYRWIGSVPHARALGWIARSHLLVVSSVMEGGANVIAEAARIGTPVLASRVSGNVGMLGTRYPGLYPLYDEAALARLIKKTFTSKIFQKTLKRALRARRGRFAPASERSALLAVVRSLP
jgi:putative glycosyltransferase (TIGR04348 family)